MIRFVEVGQVIEHKDVILKLISDTEIEVIKLNDIENKLIDMSVPVVNKHISICNDNDDIMLKCIM